MKNIYFMANIYADDDSYSVEFPDLPGCFSYAETYEEAVEMAKDALSGYLFSVLRRFIKVNRPSNVDNPNLVPICPDPEIALALWLRWQRENRQLSQEQMAKQCELELEEYRRLESANEPALKALTKIEHGLGQSIFAM